MFSPLKQRHGSIFKSLFGILALLIALAMVINMAIVFYVHDSLKNEFLDEQELFIDNYATSIDHAFAGIENIFNYLQNSSELETRKNPSYFTRKDWLTNEKAILMAMSTYTAISPNVTDIFVYYFDYPYLYTNKGVVNPIVYHDNRFQADSGQWMDMLHEQYNLITLCKYDAERNSRLNLYPNTYSYSANSDISGIYLMQSIKQANNSVIGTICVELDEKLIGSIFKDEHVMQNRQIFVRSMSGKLIASNRSETDLERIEQMVPLNEIVGTSRYVSGHGLISHRLSEHMEMEYIVYTPQNALFKNFGYVFTVATWVTILALGLLLVCAYTQSQRMYRPFRNILRNLGEVDTACDEADYIAQQVIELLSANRRMNTKLENSGRMVLQAVLYKIIMGRPALNDAVQTVNLEVGGIEDGWFMLIVIRMDLPTDQEELFYVEHHDAFDVHIREHLGLWLIDALETRPDEYTVILSIRPEEQEEVYAALHGMEKDWAGRIPGAAYYIGVSHVTEGIHSLRNGYCQAIQALRNRPVQSDDVIFRASMASAASEIPYIPNDLEQRLRSGLEKGEKDHVSAYVKEVLDRNWCSNITCGAFSAVCMVINQYLFRLIHNKESQEQSRLIRLKTENDIYSARRYTEIVISNLNITADILASTQKTSTSFIDQAIDYVNAHFREGINLDCVAQALGYSPNHLSRNFRLKSGVGFTDYLNGKRVMFAKEQLTSTRMNLQDLAEQCGFSSANQLIRVFEKYEGITPNEYRKQERIKLAKRHGD